MSQSGGRGPSGERAACAVRRDPGAGYAHEAQSRRLPSLSPSRLRRPGIAQQPVGLRALDSPEPWFSEPLRQRSCRSAYMVSWSLCPDCARTPTCERYLTVTRLSCLAPSRAWHEGRDVLLTGYVLSAPSKIPCCSSDFGLRTTVRFTSRTLPVRLA
jgi:hypothetical protein